MQNISLAIKFQMSLVWNYWSMQDDRGGQITREADEAGKGPSRRRSSLGKGFRQRMRLCVCLSQRIRTHMHAVSLFIEERIILRKVGPEGRLRTNIDSGFSVSNYQCKYRKVDNLQSKFTNELA